MATCKSCNAEILWVKTAKNQKAMPLDAAPAADGNIVMTHAGAAFVNEEQAAMHRGLGNSTFKSHFATCKHAAKHRRRA